MPAVVVRILVLQGGRCFGRDQAKSSHEDPVRLRHSQGQGEDVFALTRTRQGQATPFVLH